jgi:putative N6-adenine-specific DNA methylase
MDPCCGSGTLPLEAALMARNVAPGLSRTFACEGWPTLPARVWKDARAAAYADILTGCDPEIYGADIDPDAIALAKANAAAAGVDDCVRFEVKPLAEQTLPGPRGVAVINPPYGERIGDTKQTERLYREMGRVFADRTWSVCVLTADEFFEASFGRKADAKRKLFNGGIKADYYQFKGRAV